MSSQGFPDDGGQLPEDVSPSEERIIERISADPSLLDEVLQRTEAAEDASASSFEAKLGPLLQVALRHRGEPFTLEPVAVELVQAALEDHFRRLSAPSECWREVAKRLATTLFEDPVARDRLAAFWSSLSAIQQ